MDVAASDGTETLPTIRLGHKDWPVAEYVWRDTKKLLPKMQRVLRALNAATSGGGIVEEEHMDLIGDVLFGAISRAQTVTREDFDKLPISMRQIMKAIPVIARQADLEAPKTGEAEAPPTSSTGTT
jgi:hypothetical protein